MGATVQAMNAAGYLPPDQRVKIESVLREADKLVSKVRRGSRGGGGGGSGGGPCVICLFVCCCARAREIHARVCPRAIRVTRARAVVFVPCKTRDSRECVCAYTRRT